MWQQYRRTGVVAERNWLAGHGWREEKLAAKIAMAQLSGWRWRIWLAAALSNVAQRSMRYTRHCI